MNYDANGVALFHHSPIKVLDTLDFENDTIRAHRIGRKWRCEVTWHVAVREFCTCNIMATELDALAEIIPQQKQIVQILRESLGDKLFDSILHLPEEEYLQQQEPIDDYWQEKIYLDFLKKRQIELLAPQEATQLTPQQAPTHSQSFKFSLRQVALLHVYQGAIIPKAADELARQYGHQSGAKLYGHYLTVSQRAGRIGEEIVGQKLSPMIKDIAAVIPHLADKAQQQAKSELQTLETRK